MPLSLVFLLGSVAPVGATGSADWPAFLYSADHASFSGSTTITPADAASLVKAWSFTSAAATMAGQPAPGFTAGPVVSGGRVYIGSITGVFYALDEVTGKVAWSRFLGFVRKTTCNARGINATATVAVDPVTLAPTVYVSGGDGYLYALDAGTGKLVWRNVIAIPSTTVNDYYDWSSPTVANGHVYVGVSSQCDTPLVRGGVKAFDQHSGVRIATWYSVPKGLTGGSVWSSVAADGSSLFATTGNAPNGQSGYWNSVVRLDPVSLKPLAHWQVPNADAVPDSDFGASPTIFSVGGTDLVGACNKDGWYYVWRGSDLALQWKFKVATGSPSGIKSCLGAAIWNGSSLFIGGPFTTIGGVSYRGSIRRLNPVTGKPDWAKGLPGTVIGSPAGNAGGVLAVPMYDYFGGTNGVAIVNATTGSVLLTIPTKWEFAQPVFAGGYLFVATVGNVLAAYRVP